MGTKKAYFVVGPESSGTRMITEALIRCGVEGNATHAQVILMDYPPEVFVIRRSVPHGGVWPKLLSMKKDLIEKGYEVIPIVIYRDERITMLSQLRNRHARSKRESRKKIKTAKNIIEQTFEDPIVLQYETFVGDSRIREAFFKRLGFAKPRMQFFDGNEKYD